MYDIGKERGQVYYSRRRALSLSRSKVDRANNTQNFDFAELPISTRRTA